MRQPCASRLMVPCGSSPARQPSISRGVRARASGSVCEREEREEKKKRLYLWRGADPGGRGQKLQAAKELTWDKRKMKMKMMKQTSRLRACLSMTADMTWSYGCPGFILPLQQEAATSGS